MPHYELQCDRTTLSDDQKAAIALGITQLHCRTFNAPSIFVRVTITTPPEGNAASNVADFSGGKVMKTNYLTAHLRPRPNKAPDTLSKLVDGLTSIWNNAVRVPSSSHKPMDPPGRLDDDKALHNIFIMEDIAGGMEQGVMLPLAGSEGKWIEENMAEFKRRAEMGDQSMGALVEELGRGLGSGPKVSNGS